MQIIRHIVNWVRTFLTTVTRLVVKTFGIRILSQEETKVYLQPYQILTHPADHYPLPAVPDPADPAKLIFTPTEAITDPIYVWHYKPGAKPAVQLPYGAILTDRKMLCTNYDFYHVDRNFVTPGHRNRYTRPLLIAPWSHHLDGVRFGGYYDFMMLVAAKLSRIKDALPAEVFAGAAVAYPLFNTAYEREVLGLLGVEPSAVYDSRLSAVTFESCVLGNSGHWFYPNAADVLALKKYVEAALSIPTSPRRRIYVSRGGRRRIANEAELIGLLKRYDFTIIEDQPRTVAEQVAIYKSASFILGPHGASFTNIIWCEPGTHLFELFSPTYVPDFFHYLAVVMQMGYSAHYEGPTPGRQRNALEEDMHVSLPDLERALEKLLSPVY